MQGCFCIKGPAIATVESQLAAEECARATYVEEHEADEGANDHDRQKAV
jgi:hypothetical protein